MEDIGRPFFVINLAITLCKSLLKTHGADLFLFDIPIPPSPLFHVCFQIASNALLKRDALNEVLEGVFKLLDDRGNYMPMTSTRFISGINPQPVGFEEIQQGAKNRIGRCVNIVNDILVSIENGIILNEEDQHYYDYALVLIQFGSTGQCESFSKGVYVPNSIVEESRQTQFQKTCGELLASKSREQLLVLVQEYEMLTFGKLHSTTLDTIPMNIDPADWHILFGPRTRQQIIK